MFLIISLSARRKNNVHFGNLMFGERYDLRMHSKRVMSVGSGTESPFSRPHASRGKKSATEKQRTKERVWTGNSHYAYSFMGKMYFAFMYFVLEIQKTIFYTKDNIL